MKTTSALRLCAIPLVCLPYAAQADSPVILGFDLSVGVADRGGNAINSSGFPGEADNFAAYNLSGFATIPLGDVWLMQVEAFYENNSVGEITDGFFTDDSATNSSQVALQFGYAPGDWYLGAFAALNEVDFTQFDRVQDATTRVYGLAAAYHLPDWTLAAQLGVFNSSATDPEVLDDGRFISLSATHFFNDGQTALGARFTYGEGDQDVDSGAGADPVDFIGIGLWAEHALDTQMLGGQPSIYAAVDWLSMEEARSGGGFHNVDETRISLGFRIVFGANSLQDRARRTAPRLPDYGRWQGLTPIVD